MMQKCSNNVVKNGVKISPESFPLYFIVIFSNFFEKNTF